MQSNPRRVGGLIFDLDGTLVDSFADIATALNLTRTRYGHPALPGEEVRRHVGSGSAHLVRTLVPVDADTFAEAYAHYLTAYEAHILDESRLFDGAEAVLEHFADRRLAVVTNKGHALAVRVLQALGVLGCFDPVLGHDSLPRVKPDPMPVQHCLRAWDLPAQDVVLVGDGLHDLHAGRAAGVCTVAVTTGVERRETLQAEGPDHVVDRLDALLELFA